MSIRYIDSSVLLAQLLRMGVAYVVMEPNLK